MTLGEKIKKYRLLNNMTQKELGLSVGFSAATADSRIRKYESDTMAPKDSIRKKLADALNVDLSALSDIDIQNYEDVMQVLFLFESVFDIDIDKQDGKTLLIFDDNNKDIRTLITFLNIWKNQKKAFLKDPVTATEEQVKKYEIWKSRFAGNIEAYFDSKLNEINEHYSRIISTADSFSPHAKTTADITSLLRRIIESGLTVSTTFTDASVTPGGPGFIFAVNELLKPPSQEAENLFAQFFSEMNHLVKLGAGCTTEFQMIDRTLTITYFIPIPSFAVIKSQIDDLLAYLASSDNDISRDLFELSFNSSLETHFNDIEDEIEFYQCR